MRNNIDYLVGKLEQLDISIDNRQIEQLVLYYEMLIEKNKVMNLTGITEPREVADKHFADSLSITKINQFQNVKNLIDVGTGAGFPGIPLKILFPELEVVLLDSLNKRICFLQEVVEALDLKKIECIHGRSEDLARNREYREKFDLCVSRAVANLSSLSELCIPFVKIGGNFIAYKAGGSEEEIRNAESAVGKLGGKIGRIVEFSLPETDLSRVLVEIKKVKPTVGKYPRKAGIPVKEPL